MLTASQCETIAYLTDDGLVCPACLTPPEANGAERAEDVCRYSAEEDAGYDGLYCDRCGGEIVEPTSRDFVVTIRLRATPRVDADTLECFITNMLDLMDEIEHVREIVVKED